MFLTGARAVVTGASAAGFPFLRIDEYEIDIRGHVQLAAAELAHPHHDEALAFALLAYGRAQIRFQARLEPD